MSALSSPITDFQAVVASSNNPAYQLFTIVRDAHPHSQIVMVSRLCHEALRFEEFLAQDASGQVVGPSAPHNLRQHIKFEYEAKKASSPERWMSFEERQLRDMMGASMAQKQASADQVQPELQNGHLDVVWHDHFLRIYKATWSPPFSSQCHAYSLVWEGETDELGRLLVAETSRWQALLHEKIWVFHGRWNQDHSMWKAIQSAQPNDLVLPPETFVKLRRDTEGFFASRELYASLNVPWKRGLLLMGPPGLGKTQTIKTLLRLCSSVPALYVQSFKVEHGGPEVGIQAIFRKAREAAPCILVLEDLDSLITSKTRSFLLNQLDGFEPNDGILVIATANDASKLDDAILRRPSRFDTHYFFELPDAELRERFVWTWIDKVGKHRFEVKDSEFQDLNAAVRAVVERTESWSFAFLKELFLSFLLDAAGNVTNKGEGSTKFPVSKLVEQAALLQAQAVPPPKSETKNNDAGAAEESESEDGC